MVPQLAASALAGSSTDAYQDFVNPQWVKLLTLLGMNVEYERCSGCELFVRDGPLVLDFLSGYCVHNVGHNHPYVVQALKDELDKSGPVRNSHPDLRQQFHGVESGAPAHRRRTALERLRCRHSRSRRDGRNLRRILDRSAGHGPSRSQYLT